MIRLPLYPPSRPQSIGEVLDAGFRLFRATLGLCLPYGALLVIAGQLGNFYDLASGRLPRTTGGRDPTWWTWYGVGLVLTLLLWGALILRQHAIATHSAAAAPATRFPASRTRCSMRAELLAALQRLPQLVALTLLASAGVAAGLLLLVAPGLYLAVALAFGTPILLLRRDSGVVGALTESERIVRGHWGRTALLLLLVILMMLAAYGVLVTILTAASIAIADVADRELIASFSVIVGVIAGSITAPFGSAMILAILGDLWRRDELRREAVEAGAGASVSSGARPENR